MKSEQAGLAGPACEDTLQGKDGPWKENRRLSFHAASDPWRLSCQARVNGNIEVEVSE
jgi:Na+-transporting NADH:ubiquinone oxidoreductase subunit NqrF